MKLSPFRFTSQLIFCPLALPRLLKLFLIWRWTLKSYLSLSTFTSRSRVASSWYIEMKTFPNYSFWCVLSPVPSFALSHSCASAAVVFSVMYLEIGWRISCLWQFSWWILLHSALQEVCSDVAINIFFYVNSHPFLIPPAHDSQFRLPTEKFVQLVYNRRAYSHELINK